MEAHRYALEPHILELARFDAWGGKDVLEVGCGIGTDASRFARAGARYSGVDLTETAIELARRRFELAGLTGSFRQADAGRRLPFGEAAFDLVYANGVIHHMRDAAAAVGEFHRVLRPGGTAIVMLYHRGSLNYRFNILVVRRLLAASLVVPGAQRLMGRLARADAGLVADHRQLLQRYGLRYLTDAGLFLSNNTDGPGNPLSRVYSRREARDLFGAFETVDFAIRFLNLRLYPKGDVLAATRVARLLERRIGWHLYVIATK